MSEKDIKITMTNPESPTTIPIVAAQLTTAIYTALLLKKMSGVEITAEIEQEVQEKVISTWRQVAISLKDCVSKN